ncbi:MobC family plasmid mobilization relaxosome protein [Phocaeicola oris]|uniref:MobC family plasmid mobilization relaxosome protein n=1 Tax=Phocaeicola oris TaxID=2896850 RepID=UPI00234EA70A|nr:MobC family plasmid mobilization relaxosome protein [Phocaeicola oris]MCE2617117.1 MobC family plasmid mobilization relaxosome protein [Phocaeicola oris]
MTRNSGGRPPLKIEEKMNYRVSVKMNTEQYYTLKAKAQSAGMTIPEFVRVTIFKVNVIPRLSKDEAWLIRQLCGMANNVNQLAHKANAEGYFTVTKEWEQMAVLIDELIKRIKKCSEKS